MKSITVFLLLLFINLLTLFALFGLQLPNAEGKSTIFKYLIFLVVYALPGYIIISMIVKKEDLENKSLELGYKKIYGWGLIGYALLSVFLLILAIKFK